MDRPKLRWIEPIWPLGGIIVCGSEIAIDDDGTA